MDHEVADLLAEDLQFEKRAWNLLARELGTCTNINTQSKEPMSRHVKNSSVNRTKQLRQIASVENLEFIVDSGTRSVVTTSETKLGWQVLREDKTTPSTHTRVH